MEDIIMTWSKEGIPHKGWDCIDVVDLAENIDRTSDIPYEQCEMCGNERIRFVHIMRHPQYPHELRVGCVCAEKMSGDYVNPRKAEDTLRKRASRRKNFNNTEWRFNPEKQTYSKKYKGEYITIKRSRYGNFGIFFANKIFWNYNGRKFNSFDSAEQAAFEIFEEFHTTQADRERQYWLSHRNDYGE